MKISIYSPAGDDDEDACPCARSYSLRSYSIAILDRSSSFPSLDDLNMVYNNNDGDDNDDDEDEDKDDDNE
jgi:hypothetical protein